GNSACTACAKTCAHEWRITARPSSSHAATGVNTLSSVGTCARSLIVPSVSRTTTTASGPLLGKPSSLIAAPTAVPAGQEIGSYLSVIVAIASDMFHPFAPVGKTAYLAATLMYKI